MGGRVGVKVMGIFSEEAPLPFLSKFAVEVN